MMAQPTRNMFPKKHEKAAHLVPPFRNFKVCSVTLRGPVLFADGVLFHYFRR